MQAYMNKRTEIENTCVALSKLPDGPLDVKMQRMDMARGLAQLLLDFNSDRAIFYGSRYKHDGLVSESEERQKDVMTLCNTIHSALEMLDLNDSTCGAMIAEKVLEIVDAPIGGTPWNELYEKANRPSAADIAEWKAARLPAPKPEPARAKSAPKQPSKKRKERTEKAPASKSREESRTFPEPDFDALPPPNDERVDAFLKKMWDRVNEEKDAREKAKCEGIEYERLTPISTYGAKDAATRYAVAIEEALKGSERTQWKPLLRFPDDVSIFENRQYRKGGVHHDNLGWIYPTGWGSSGFSSFLPKCFHEEKKEGRDIPELFPLE